MSTVSALDTVALDPGDMGLVFIEGVGFRPAEGTDLAHGQVVDNVCVIKCHVGYDDLPEAVTNYVPMCGGEGGPGKWAGKWEVPLDLLAPPVWYTAPPAAPLVPVAWLPPASVPWTPWDTPWTPPTGCCYVPPTDCCTIPPVIPPAPVDLPASGLLLGAVLIGAIIIRSAQALNLFADIQRTS